MTKDEIRVLEVFVNENAWPPAGVFNIPPMDTAAAADIRPIARNSLPSYRAGHSSLLATRLMTIYFDLDNIHFFVFIALCAITKTREEV